MSIEVMKRVLEALENNAWVAPRGSELEAAYIALRQAIEEAEKPPIYVQRATNDYENGWEDGFKAGAQKEKGSTPRNVDPRLLLGSTFNCNTTSQAEKQEPESYDETSWQMGYWAGKNANVNKFIRDACDRLVTPETTPHKKWVGLTDDDLRQIILVSIGVAEAKLKEKNGG